MTHYRLRIRDYRVDVGVVEVREQQNDGKIGRTYLEVDFVANLGSKRYYIQSADTMPSMEKSIQEKRPLRHIDDSFKKIIIVKDPIKIMRDDNGFVTMGIRDFLLNANSLDL